jgi:hypothetical protein
MCGQLKLTGNGINLKGMRKTTKNLRKYGVSAELELDTFRQ